MSARSRLLCTLLKTADAGFITQQAALVRQQVAGGAPLSGFMGPDDVLIPVPGSAPSSPGVPSVADQLARALVGHGLGGQVWGGLRRICAVPKSATAPPGSRPTVGAHFESLALEPAGLFSQQVVLVDDVITKGRTMLAAAARVRETFPKAQIRAFALHRTMGFVQEVHRLLEPCVGEIRWRAGDAWRNP